MFTHILRRSLLLLIVAIVPALPMSALADATGHFTRPAELEPDIAFWRRIYTEVTTEGGLLHDAADLGIVYEKLKFPADLSPKQRSRRIEDVKKKYARILDRIASGATDLSEEELRVQDLWPKGTRRSRFEQASEEVRFQLGQADRFREGIIRSGAWRDQIAATFERRACRVSSLRLPHVESSFNTYAYSKVGAAGMWQFMRGTGRRFLRIDAVVDERLDPYRSTEAAARFLEQNYIVLGSWPLALTAYNHGPAGMRRAQEQLGTSDITTIVRKYNSRSFGFASRNFYVAFLAALEIDADPDKFFGPIRRNPRRFEPCARRAELCAGESHRRGAGPGARRAAPAQSFTAAFRMERLAHIPRGFELRVPPHVDLSAALTRISGGERYQAQVAETQHRVRSGETLSIDCVALWHQRRTTRGTQWPRSPVSHSCGAGACTARHCRRRCTDRRGPGREGARARHDAADRCRGHRESLCRQARRHAFEDRDAPRPERRGADGAEQHPQSQLRLRRSGARAGRFCARGAAGRGRSSGRRHRAVPAVTEPQAIAEAVEPVSEREAEEIGPALVPGTQAAASADPGDYSVHDGDMIVVQAAETLGHYAEWLDVRASQLRKLNRMSFATPVVVGRKVKLDFSRITPDQFEAKRAEYHRQLQEAFFTQFRIKDTSTHVIKPGESIWVLAQQRYNIPIWLLRQYNPDLDLGSLKPGAKLVIPIVESTANGEPAAA